MGWRSIGSRGRGRPSPEKPLINIVPQKLNEGRHNPFSAYRFPKMICISKSVSDLPKHFDENILLFSLRKSSGDIWTPLGKSRHSCTRPQTHPLWLRRLLPLQMILEHNFECSPFKSRAVKISLARFTGSNFLQSLWSAAVDTLQCSQFDKLARIRDWLIDWESQFESQGHTPEFAKVS